MKIIKNDNRLVLLCVLFFSLFILTPAISEAGYNYDEGPRLFIANTENKLYKDVYGTIDQRSGSDRDFHVIANIKKDEYFITVRIIHFDFYRSPPFYGAYYFDQKNKKLIYGLIKKEGTFHNNIYDLVSTLLRNRINVDYEYLLNNLNLIGRDYQKGEKMFLSKKYYDHLLMNNITISLDEGSMINVFAKTDDEKYYLTRFILSNGEEFFYWIHNDGLVDSKKWLHKKENNNLEKESVDNNGIFLTIFIVISTSFFLIISFTKWKQWAEEQRSKEIRRQERKAEEEENRKKTEEARRQQQERYRQAEEIREELKRQKQWAEAQQAEENRRKEDELRRKEEELRRQAEEIKRQKDRLDEEFNNKRKSQAKNVIYPRTLQEAFDVLGTRSGLTLDEYKKIFRNEVVKYHPDKTKNLGDRLQKQAEEEMKAINMAWDIIKKHLS